MGLNNYEKEKQAFLEWYAKDNDLEVSYIEKRKFENSSSVMGCLWHGWKARAGIETGL